MAQMTRTWWGQRFIQALERFTDPGRLGRGRSYARGGRILSHTLERGKVAAKVEGKINPYFGVYEVPIYTTTVQITPIPEAQWHQLVQRFASRASIVSQLLMNEMPAGVEDACAELGLHLLPAGQQDFKTRCSCPDYWNPCKHIAGVCYFLAAKLDQDPFLLFELRGLSRDRLKEMLVKTPLGGALASALEQRELPLEPVASCYPRPQREAAAAASYEAFWRGRKRLPPSLAPLTAAAVPAVLIRKAGDYPAFWDQDLSFIEVMTEFYERVRNQNKDIL